MVIGATERSLLSRVVHGVLVFGVIETLDTPVLLTEQPSSRLLRKRLLGRN